jgi:TldD protein
VTFLFFDTQEAEETANDVIRIFEKNNVDYGDVRFSQVDAIVIGKDKEEETINSGKNFGFHLRVYKKGEWRSAALATIEKNKIYENAKKISKFAPKEKTVSIKKQEVWKLNKEVKSKEVASEEKLEWVRDSFKTIRSFSPKIVNVTCSLSNSVTEKLFVNTEGSKLREKVPRSRIVFFVLAKEGKNIQFDYFSVGKLLGYEIIDKLDINEISKNICSNAINLLKAEQPPSGRIPLIVDGDVAGLIAHESFGHGTEADQVLRGRSFLKDCFGQKVAGESVSLVDNGSLPNEFGSFTFDDEGIRSKKTALIENGIFKSFLHSRETASVLNAEPTGNGRAQDFSRKVYVRMTNTYFEPQDWKLEEMLEGVKYGIYLVKGGSGMEDPEGGGIQVSSHIAWLIENGEKTKLLRGCTLTGRVLDILKNIDAVGNDFILRPGMCGKGHEDSVPVTSGGPHLRIKEAIVSGG